MSDLQYHRPTTLKEALKLLEKGIPLAGGTALIPDLKPEQTVIDLQALGLDTIKKTKNEIRAGATVTLQTLIDSGADIPAALTAACHLEANLNLRNMATLGGTIMSADGRSPLMTSLLALNAGVHLEPGGEVISLDQLLDDRDQDRFSSLIIEVAIPSNARLAYDQVSRAPMDRPIVCAAVGGMDDLNIVLGGYGPRPQRVAGAEEALRRGDGIDVAATAARETYAQADDPWASGEYRGHVAEVLIRRLLAEVMG
jgi:probable selenate reductase FAD-binding subunit